MHNNRKEFMEEMNDHRKECIEDVPLALGTQGLGMGACCKDEVYGMKTGMKKVAAHPNFAKKKRKRPQTQEEALQQKITDLEWQVTSWKELYLESQRLSANTKTQLGQVIFSSGKEMELAQQAHADDLHETMKDVEERLESGYKEAWQEITQQKEAVEILKEENEELRTLTKTRNVRKESDA